MSVIPRGIRNNNPGNIRHGAAWQGMAAEQTDPAFVQFVSPSWGIRAIAKILLHYEEEGLNNVRDIINRWAPPVENDTGAYVKCVADDCGVDPAQPISVLAMLPKIIPAIIEHENGEQPYPLETIQQGINLV